MLGAGLIADHYATAIQSRRSRDTVTAVYSRGAARAEDFARRHSVAHSFTDLAEAVNHPDVDIVVIALPNSEHLAAVEIAAAAGKPVLCTKPLGRTVAEARRMLELVEEAGVFAGYLEDLVFTPKTLAAVATTRAGLLGEIVSVRSREAHSGPHSSWFLDAESAGGGVLLDLGSHCVEIIRGFVGKDIRPLEVMCWTDIRTAGGVVEDNAFALVKFENGAIGQVDVSWTARGGMDLRDEVNGTEGTLRLDHFQHTGYELFTSSTVGGTEKADGGGGWQFPVADDVTATGNLDMFREMFDAVEEGRAPSETFLDGYIVNAVLDACYRSAAERAWVAVELERSVKLFDTAYDDHAVRIAKSIGGAAAIREQINEMSR